jgi:polyvinyl alcohol dehydrogenase (cytochrome)
MIFGGKILLGQTVDGVSGYRGAIMALHLVDGSTAWRFEVDPILGADAQVIGAYNRGCGSVWSTGAVDEINRLVAFGTGDCQTNATPPYHEAVLALDVDSGALRWVFRPHMIDGCDFDFGASPNVFDIGGQRHIGIGNKNGTYYVLHSDSGSPAGQLQWSTNIVFGGTSGGFIGSTAFDGQRIYGGTGYGDFGAAALCDPSNPRDLPIQDPSFHALNLKTGTIEWEVEFSYTFGASTVGNGVVFNGTAGLDGLLLPALQVFDAATGQIVGEFPMPGSVNSSATIVDNMIFFGTGNSFDGSGSSVQAFVLP